MSYSRIQAPLKKKKSGDTLELFVLFLSAFIAFSVRAKMCIMEELQHEPGLSQEETEWTGLYWSLILHKQNDICGQINSSKTIWWFSVSLVTWKFSYV